MLSNIYDKKDNIITTSISGGREHYPYRHQVKPIDSYKYEISYGENYHTLSMVIFGSDKHYWAIADINKPIDVFDMKSGTVVLLPTDLVRNINGVKKFV